MLDQTAFDAPAPDEAEADEVTLEPSLVAAPDWLFASS